MGGRTFAAARRRGRPALLPWLGLLTAACAPAMSWREFRPPGLQLRLELPCRPEAAARRLTLGGTEVEWQLHACTVGDQTFALASADLGDPRYVAAALAELGAAARANVAGRIVDEEAAEVGGMTPQPAARRWRIAGTLSDGRAVAQEVAVFAYGHRVYQATVVGAHVDADAAQTFFAGLKVTP